MVFVARPHGHAPGFYDTISGADSWFVCKSHTGPAGSSVVIFFFLSVTTGNKLIHTAKYMVPLEPLNSLDQGVTSRDKQMW